MTELLGFSVSPELTSLLDASVEGKSIAPKKTNPETNRKIRTIMSLDFSRITRKLQIRCEDGGKGWSACQTVNAEQLYREFLIISVLYPHTAAPTVFVDEFWHTHILDTKHYVPDCEAIFGSYFHHDPYLGLNNDYDDLVRRFKITNELYLREFGHSPTGDVIKCGDALCLNCMSSRSMEQDHMCTRCGNCGCSH